MKKHLFFLMVFICAFATSDWCEGQTMMTTFAGTGALGYTGDHGPATLAKLTSPSGVAVDKYGNVYIADQNSSCVRKVDTAGIITSVTGSSGMTGHLGDGGPATDAQLNWPEGLAVDDSGNLFIADQFNNEIRKVTAATGIITTIAGDYTRIGYGGDGAAATDATLWHPNDITVDRSGNVYFVDQDNSLMRKLDAATGIITTLAGIAGTTASPGYNSDGIPGTAAMLNFPEGIVADSVGNVYIADLYNNRIRRVDAVTGIITTVAGNGTGGYSGDGGPATSAEIYNASAVALDDHGNIYISDYYNSRIRKVSGATGIITTIAGNGTAAYCCDCHPATAAEIYYPQGVAVDKKGNVYIADYNNARVRKVTDSFNCPSLAINERASQPVLKIFPNPAQGQFCIQVNNIQTNEKAYVYNALGEKIFETEIHALQTNIDLPELPSGIYILYVKSDEISIVQKLTIAY